MKRKTFAQLCYVYGSWSFTDRSAAAGFLRELLVSIVEDGDAKEMDSYSVVSHAEIRGRLLVARNVTSKARIDINNTVKRYLLPFEQPVYFFFVRTNPVEARLTGLRQFIRLQTNRSDLASSR